MNTINTAVLEQYNSATHSIIKGFVLADDLTELERLARIAVIHAVMEYEEGIQNFTEYVEKLLSILLERKATAKDAKAAVSAVAAVHKLRVSNLAIVEDCQLNEFGMDLIHSIAESIALVTPERFLPMQECTKAPDYPEFRTMNIEGTAVVKTPLIKNKSFANKRKDSPELYKSLDALWTHQYTLNEDIMHIINLPEAFSYRQFAIGASPAFAKTFSFRFTFDHRGRTYARSMYAQPQGDGFAKSVLNLGTKKALGAKGLNALSIHYANVSGQDKISLQDRIAWAKTDGLAKAIDMSTCLRDWDLIKLHSDLSEKDINKGKAFEEYAAAMDFFRAMHSEDPTKYESNLVCHQDATNSGFQFGAALTGDLETAKATNLLASHYSEKPKDLYKLVARSMIGALQEKDVTTWACVINRKSVKKVVMVTGYGAGQKTQLRAFSEGLEAIGEGNLIPRMAEVGKALIFALEENASALLNISDHMRKHAKSTSDQINWTTADGFVVKHAYIEEESFGTGKYKVIDRASKEMDEHKLSSALPPNFIHSIDGNMLRTASIKARNGNMGFVPIHDSFGTHACSFFDLGRALREAFIEVMSYDWYNNFCMTNGFLPTLSNTGDLDLTEVRKSTYMFS